MPFFHQRIMYRKENQKRKRVGGFIDHQNICDSAQTTPSVFPLNDNI